MDERERGAALLEIMRVGPKGYIHGWIFTGAPGVGAHVVHPHHGRGTVTAHSGTHATVKFSSGAEHSFEARPGPGPGRLEHQGFSEHAQHARDLAAEVRARRHGDITDPGGAPDQVREKSNEHLGNAAGHLDQAAEHLSKGNAEEGRRSVSKARKSLFMYHANRNETRLKQMDLAAKADKLHSAVMELALRPTAQRGSDLKYGHGSALWAYWTHGEGFAKWSGAAHKWTTLHALLLKAGVPAHSADGLTTNIITAVMPGYMRQAHAKAQRADAKNKPYGAVTYADPKNGKYPLNSEARIRAAWSYINMPKNAAMYPLNGVTLSSVKARIRAAMKRIGADVADTASSTASRVEAVFSRIWELEDIRIVSRAQGDGSGRLVEAYAAVFNVPAEIHDQHGDYNEENDPGSFNRSVDHASRQSRSPFRCIYNHGLTLHGTASDRGSIPIGTPEEVRAESRGLLTRTLYNQTPLADEVLEAIRTGGITAQSYTGRILRSSPELRRGEKYRAGRDGRLPTVRRLELALREYGPTPFPAFSGAEILGVRMSTPGEYAPGPDTPQEDEALPPDGEPAAGDPPPAEEEAERHSARHHQHALFVLRSTEMREKAGLVW